MKKKYGRSVLANLMWNLLRSPVQVVEVILFLLLSAVLLTAFIGYAGFLPFAPTHVQFSLLLLVVTFVQGCLVFFREDSLRLYGALFFPLPFLAYAALHYLFIAPFPWHSALHLMVFLQAYALFVLVLNYTNRGSGRQQILIVLHLIYFVAIVIAFLQFYLFPDWSPLEGRMRVQGIAGAAGFFSDPVNLAGFALLIMPLAFSITVLRRFAGPVRILCGLITFFGFIAYLLSTHIGGLIIMLLLLLVLPHFLSGEWHARKRYYKFFFWALLLMLPLFWFGTDALRERIEYFLHYTPDDLGNVSRQVAYMAFLQSPWLGHGLGSFALLWESRVPELVAGSAIYPVSGFAELLSSMGVVGFLLVFIPIALIFRRAYTAWQSHVFYRVDPDIESRLKRLSSRQKSKLRDKLKKGKVPTPKIAIGGILLGLGSFLLYSLHDYSIQLAAVLIFVAMLLANLVTFADNSIRIRRGKRFRATLAFLPFCLALLAYGFGVEKLYTQQLVYEARERLEAALQNPNRIFQDPAVIYELEQQLQAAVDLYPGHGGAWSLYGEVYFARLHMELFDAVEIAAMALEKLQIAEWRAPMDWRVHHNLARAKAMLNAPVAEVKAHLQDALDLAPHRAEPLAFLGAMIFVEGGDVADAERLLRSALDFNPDYWPADSILERMAMGGGAGVRATDSSLLGQAILAENFWLLTQREERVRGAGALAPDALGGVLPNLLY